MATVEDVLTAGKAVLERTEWCGGAGDAEYIIGGGDISDIERTCILGDIYVGMISLGLKPGGMYVEGSYGVGPDKLQREAVEILQSVIVEQYGDNPVIQRWFRNGKSPDTIVYKFNDNVAQSKEDCLAVFEKAIAKAGERA